MRYFKNTSWMMGEQLLRMVAGLLVGIWVARYLGPEQFGAFSYVLAFTSIVVSLAKLGLDNILIRELINHPEQYNNYLGTAFWLKLIGAMFVIILLAFILPLTSNDTTTNFYIFIISLGLIFQSTEVIGFYFESQVLAKIISICKIIQLTLSSLLKIYLILMQADLIWFVIVTLFDMVSLAISYLIAYHFSKRTYFYLYFNKNLAFKLLKNAWPLIISTILVSIYMRIDQIMIKEILGEYAVGIYSAAIKISECWYCIPILVSSSLFPAIMNAKKISNTLYLQRLQQLYIMMIWIAISIAIIVTLLNEQIVHFLYGTQYEAAKSILILHIWTSIFVFIGIIGSKWILSENLQIYANYFLIIGIIINFSLNLILIPTYGIIGSAISILISQIVSSYIAPALFKPTRLRFQMATKALFPFNKKISVEDS